MTATTPMNVEDRVTRKEGNLVSDMGSEKVMMSISSGKYYNLGQYRWTNLGPDRRRTHAG